MKKALITCLGLVGCVAFYVWFFRSVEPPPRKEEIEMDLWKPVKVVEFPDGYKIEIFGAGWGELALGVDTQSHQQRVVTSSRTIGDWTEQHGIELEENRWVSGGSLEKVVFKTEDHSLLIHARFVSPDGKVFRPEGFVDDGRVGGGKSGGNGRGFSFNAMTKPEADERTWPDFVIAVMEGGRRGEAACGPFGDEDDRENRFVFRFGEQLRSNDLSFLAIRPHMEPVEFRLPQTVVNPRLLDYIESAGAVSLPHQVGADDWKLELQKLESVILEDGSRFVVLTSEWDFWYNGNQRPQYVPGDGWGPDERQARVDLYTLRGAFLPIVQRRIPDGRLRSGHVISAKESAIRCKVVVSPTENYCYRREDALIIGSGVGQPECGTVILPIEGSLHGVLGVEHLEMNPESHHRPTKWFSVRGKWKTSSDHAAFDQAVGPISETLIVLFRDDDLFSGGTAQVGRVVIDRIGEEIHFELLGAWRGQLRSGTKWELGLVRKRPVEVVDLVVDSSALTGSD